MEIIAWSIVICWVLGLVILFISQSNESALKGNKLYFEDKKKLLHRPWGLKINELEILLQKVDDLDVRKTIRSVIFKRRWGFRILKISLYLVLIQIVFKFSQLL